MTPVWALKVLSMEVPDYSLEWSFNPEEDLTEGETFPQNKTIKIIAGRDQRQQLYTLIHEIAHALSSELGHHYEFFRILAKLTCKYNFTRVYSVQREGIVPEWYAKGSD